MFPSHELSHGHRARRQKQRHSTRLQLHTRSQRSMNTSDAAPYRLTTIYSICIGLYVVLFFLAWLQIAYNCCVARYRRRSVAAKIFASGRRPMKKLIYMLDPFQQHKKNRYGFRQFFRVMICLSALCTSRVAGNVCAPCGHPFTALFFSHFLPFSFFSSADIMVFCSAFQQASVA